MRVEGWITAFVPTADRWLTGLVTLNQPPHVDAAKALPVSTYDEQLERDVQLPPITTLAWRDDRDKASKKPTGAKVYSCPVPLAVAKHIRDGAPRGRINTYGGLKVVYHRGRPLVPGNELRPYTPGHPSRKGPMAAQQPGK